MNEKFRKFMKQISFDIIRLPENVSSSAKRIILFSILSILIPDFLSFALKGAQISLSKGYMIIAFILLLIHFGDNVLMSLFETWFDFKNDNYNQLTTSEATKIVLDISNVTKSKVFKKKNNIVQMLETSEILDISKDYLLDYWEFFLKFPTSIAQIVILFITLSVSIILELMTSTVLETLIITSFLLIGMILYFILSKKRIGVMQSYRNKRKENEIESNRLFTEIKSTDFISQTDFSYHAEKLRSKLDDNIKVNRSEHLKLNKVFILRSIIASFIMISIILVKFIVSGQFTINTFVDVVSLSSIYGTMLRRITSITNSFESIMNIVIDIDTLYDDFNNINDVYEKEKKRVIISTPIESLTVSKFSVTQDINGAFELINKQSFSLHSGDTIMSYGRTGCGKSTLINMLTGRIILTENPIYFSNGQNGFLNSIGYQTDKSMVNNYVLNEISLTDNYDSIDKEKLLEIIKGLNLYDEILRMVKDENLDFDNLSDKEKIFEFLKIRKTREFSSGQMQRLALAKLLYCLDDSIQLVALDEPFNRLDDNTCKTCISFIKQYALRNKRILLIATHQVEICRPFCNVEISFDENGEKSFIRFNR